MTIPIARDQISSLTNDACSVGAGWFELEVVLENLRKQGRSGAEVAKRAILYHTGPQKPNFQNGLNFFPSVNTDLKDCGSRTRLSVLLRLAQHLPSKSYDPTPQK